MTDKQLVLLIDHNAASRASIAQAVEAGGYDVLVREDAVAGLRQFYGSHPDIVILSLDVPDMEGWDLVGRIRALANTPVVVTAEAATLDSLQRGFDLQVDGYLVKPFDEKELLLRLNTLRDRTAGNGGGRRWLYEHGGLSIDFRSCEVAVDGEPVSLTGTEYKLLRQLVEHRGWVLSHDQILSEVWGPEYVGEKGRVKLYIWYLRQKIEAEPRDPRLIVTKRGLGYTFVG